MSLIIRQLPTKYPDNYQKNNVKKPIGPWPYGLISCLDSKSIFVHLLNINKQ